jgi:hypothetical protein
MPSPGIAKDRIIPPNLRRQASFRPRLRVGAAVFMNGCSVAGKEPLDDPGRRALAGWAWTFTSERERFDRLKAHFVELYMTAKTRRTVNPPTAVVR